jgi:CopA family copper-resistance protein
VKKITGILLFSLLCITKIYADNPVINLTVAYQPVSFAGKKIQAISVNGQIPGPTLHFKEGDHVTINVTNHLDKETAIHWHGLLVPWQMDGVLGVSQRGIPPGGVFKYQFTLHQSGTYWYHAHAGLQEQQGLYGALIIDPRQPAPYQYNKDYSVVLSDWSNTNPDQILANLKKEGDYYAPRFPLQPSLAKFLHDYRQASLSERKNLIDDYKMMQQMRMSLYDISDVAYDAFLMNGHPKSQPWTAPVKVGDVVRLRFIGAGAATIFQVKIPGTTMTMVHAEGNDIQPHTVKDFTIAPGETYDVLVKIRKPDPVIIYAESLDTVGAAVGALVTTPKQDVHYKKIRPFPEPEPVTRNMMTFMMADKIHGEKPLMTMDHTMPMKHAMPMNHSMNMNMPTEPTLWKDSLLPPNANYDTSLGTKYQPLKAAVKTNNPDKPVSGVIKMELFGYMDRYIWFINGTPEYKAKPIVLEPGKRYRVIFTNTSMMHHPMHIHGHWFILRKGDGAYDPLLHTIDVPPGATITADLDTDASGQWFFHCHMLYHMMTGMSRVFQYSTLIELTQNKIKPEDQVKKTPYHNRSIVRIDEVRPIDVPMVKHPMAHPAGFWFASFVDGGFSPIQNSQRLTYKGLYGPDYHKLELFTNDAETSNGKVENADMDIFYWHLLNQFWAIKGGVNYFYRPAQRPYWQPGIGLEGLLPYFIDTDLRSYFYKGSAKLDLELTRDTQLTNNVFLRTGIRSILASKTIPQAELGNGLNQMRYTLRPYYRAMPGLNLFVEYEYEQDYGSFKHLQRQAGDATIQNTLTLGISVLF